MGIDGFGAHLLVANKIDVRFGSSPMNEIQVRCSFGFPQSGVPLASITKVRSNSACQKDFSQCSAPDDFPVAILVLKHVFSITVSPQQIGKFFNLLIVSGIVSKAV